MIEQDRIGKYLGIVRVLSRELSIWSYEYFVSSALLRLLHSEDYVERRGGILGSIALKDTIGLDAIRKILANDPDILCRAYAALALGMLGCKKDILLLSSVLAELEKTKDSNCLLNRIMVALSLLEGDEEVRHSDLIRPQLFSSDEVTRGFAALSLGFLQDTQSIPKICELLHEAIPVLSTLIEVSVEFVMAEGHPKQQQWLYKTVYPARCYVLSLFLLGVHSDNMHLMVPIIGKDHRLRGLIELLGHKIDGLNK